MGIVHVLTGPDHLSALATLSANVGNCRAFWYGVRWGVGHSIGLIVVGSGFILTSRINDNGNANDQDAIAIPERIESIGEIFVGVFMLALGCYSIVKAYRMRSVATDTITEADAEMRNNMMTDNDVDTTDSYSSTSRSSSLIRGRRSLPSNTSERSLVSISHQRVTSTSPKLRPSIFKDEIENPPLPFTLGEASMSIGDAPDAYSPRPMGIDRGHGGHDGQDHGHSHLPNMQDGISKQFLSVCIGIVHGVAGPGGVLGVIPAVQLHNLWLSTVYLGSFCVTSTLVMGCFAASYGVLSSRLSRNSDTLAYRMEIFSASLSVIVGILWLTLLYMGILHDIFP